MRRFRGSSSVALIAALALAVVSIPVAAQDYERFPGPDAEKPLSGYTRSDGTIVLSDESFCRFLLGSLWAEDELTYVKLIDKSKKQKKAKGAAFVPGSDDEIITACVDAIGAYLNAPPGEDPLVAWSRRSPVVPEALADLLAEDWESHPLMQPDEVGPAARTSGRGDLVSGPFEMVAGTWLVATDTRTCEAWSGTLHDARDADEGIDLSGSRQYLYGIDAGHYYWDVTASDCEWSVDLAPVDLGPDPNATPVPKVAVPLLFGPKWRGSHRGNPDFLNATAARKAILDVGLTIGECVEEKHRTISHGIVWGQEPIAGTLLEMGSPVDVFITGDCDILRGERVQLE